MRAIRRVERRHQQQQPARSKLSSLTGVQGVADPRVVSLRRTSRHLRGGRVKGKYVGRGRRLFSDQARRSVDCGPVSPPANSRMSTESTTHVCHFTFPCRSAKNEGAHLLTGVPLYGPTAPRTSRGSLPIGIEVISPGDAKRNRRGEHSIAEHA